jgi:hypothetical protein
MALTDRGSIRIIEWAGRYSPLAGGETKPKAARVRVLDGFEPSWYARLGVKYNAYLPPWRLQVQCNIVVNTGV